MLLAAVDVRRPTVDVGTMVCGLAVDRDTLVEVVRDVASRPSTITVDGDDDGVVFTTDPMSVSTIREGNVYEGVRLTFGALVGSARVEIGLDVSVGDPITPAPTPVHRGTDLAPLSDVLVKLATAWSKNFTAYRGALGVDGGDLPTQFSEVVQEVVTFVDPLVQHGSGSIWDPATRSRGRR